MAALTGLRAVSTGGLLRPVVTLGITQIIGFGTIYYAFGVMVAPLGAELGLSQTFAYGALSAALLTGSLVAPLAGRLIDRHGARVMMAAGSLAMALAFVLLSRVAGGGTLFAALALVEVVAALVLYDAAFAALAQAVGPRRARRAITLMTLLGGLASTVFWPLTLILLEALGWRGTWLAFGALHLLICLPLHLSLARRGAVNGAESDSETGFTPLPVALHARAMLLLGIGFSLSWVVMSAFSAQWVPVLVALGLTQSAAVAAGTLMGPAQVTARVLEMVLVGHRHPMLTALAAMGCLALAVGVLVAAPIGVVSASVFALLFGVGQGLATMVRGTVPLALFGAAGFAARLGRLASLRMVVAAASPFAMAGSLALLGPSATLVLAGLMALAALVAMALVPWRVRG